MDRTSCDVVVLGMGTSGEDAALRLASAGLDVVGVEAELIGGECPYWACLPTKWLARNARLVAEARRADGLVGSVGVTTDWATIAAGLRAEVTGDWTDGGGVSRFQARGGRFLRGRGTLIAPRIVVVDDTEVEATRGVLVATGSRPVMPPIPGLDTANPWTNREAIATERLPDRLVVLGGGAVGVELAQVFSTFGSSVTIVDAADRIVPGEEPEASAIVAGALTDQGVDLRTGVRATSVDRDGPVKVSLDDGSVVVGDELLVAVGRRANVDGVGIENAGGTVRDGAIVVDGRLRAAQGLWAIGDVTGVGMLTSVAEYQGRIAVEDILGAQPTPADYTAVPRVVFTDPEVGAVGLSEEEARSLGVDVRVQTKDLRATFRGWLHRTGNAGVIKLIVDAERDVLVGATIVGPTASETVGFLALAVGRRMPIDHLVEAIYAFPTFHGSVGEAVGAYGRGITRVLDPDTPPLVDDPRPVP